MPTKLKNKKTQPSCTNCHHFVRIDNKPACTNISLHLGKPSYKFLRTLTICSLSEYWPNYNQELGG